MNRAECGAALLEQPRRVPFSKYRIGILIVRPNLRTLFPEYITPYYLDSQEVLQHAENIDFVGVLCMFDVMDGLCKIKG
jgi:hypothetical protein